MASGIQHHPTWDEQTSTASASAASKTPDVPEWLCIQFLACHEQVAQSWPPALLQPHNVQSAKICLNEPLKHVPNFVIPLQKKALPPWVTECNCGISKLWTLVECINFANGMKHVAFIVEVPKLEAKLTNYALTITACTVPDLPKWLKKCRRQHNASYVIP